MARAVILDFYGTLAHWEDPHRTNYSTLFAAHGYALSDAQLSAYFAQYDGVEHSAHSVSEAAYEAWVRSRLRAFTAQCGVAERDQGALIDALREVDHSPMAAYPEAAATLHELRLDGWALGVCSNWGWELEAFLRQVGLVDLIDSIVTSARAGARKPHPAIFLAAMEALGVAAEDAVFVGDSWGPDVRGPQEIGMTPVHLWRAGERAGQRPPPLPTGAHRIAELSELPGLLSSRR
jgi:putative hydrolase of the HAD superfamily